MSQPFMTTNIHSVEADHYEAKALSLAFAVIGRLIAEGFLDVDFTQKDWHIEFRLKVQAVADECKAFIDGM